MKFASTIFLVLLLTLSGCGNAKLEKEIEKAESIVEKWADDLDQLTDDAGGYVRYDSDTLPVMDPWGNEITVTYHQGGMAETLRIRSMGPDGESHTDDDIISERSKVNMKGVGSGVRDNVEEVAGNTTKGMVKGLVRGIKEEFSKDGDEDDRDTAIENDIEVVESPEK